MMHKHRSDKQTNESVARTYSARYLRWVYMQKGKVYVEARVNVELEVKAKG